MSPHGNCHDPTRTLSVKEDGDSWTLIDNKKKEVRAIDYAVLTKDEDLLRVLKTEERKTYSLGRRIALGSSILAGAAVIPLVFGKSEEIAQLEDRRWSAVFLLASGGMLYEASKMPPKLKQGKNISNYRPKSMVIERLQATWPPEEPASDESNKETVLETSNTNTPPDSTVDPNKLESSETSQVPPPEQKNTNLPAEKKTEIEQKKIVEEPKKDQPKADESTTPPQEKP